MGMTPSQAKLDATRLKHLAAEGRALVYRCNYCRQVTTFLASDVVDIWGPEMKVYDPPGSCGKCGKSGYMTVGFRIVSEGDRGRLMLRRPAGTRTVQLWKSELY